MYQGLGKNGQLIIGIGITLTGENTSALTFMAPEVSSDEVLVFELTVEDGYDQISQQITIRVNNVNQAPTVTLSSDKSSVTEGGSFVLTATGTDVDGDNLSYSWSQESGPAVSINSTSETLTLVAPNVSTDSSINIKVTVSDGDLTASSSISLTVKNTVTPPAEKEDSDGGGAMGWLLLSGLLVLRRKPHRRQAGFKQAA